MGYAQLVQAGVGIQHICVDPCAIRSLARGSAGAHHIRKTGIDPKFEAGIAHALGQAAA